MDEVCVVFLDAVELQESVEVTIGDKRIPTKQLTKSVYIFSPEGESNIYRTKVKTLHYN